MPIKHLSDDLDPTEPDSAVRSQLIAEIARLTESNAELLTALKDTISDLQLRAVIDDPRDPVLNIGSGVLKQATDAIAKAK